jgi:eukaryotic-like serine/threonine-protein kinase
MTPPPLLTAFADAVVRSKLAERPAVDAHLTPPPPSPEAFAERLRAAGLLTQFQVQKLLAGRWQGLVIGPYHLLCPVARGGSGIVYLARDTRRAVGQPVPRVLALKVLSPQRAKDEPRTLARFCREMDIGKRIPAHPHLVRTFDSGESGGVHYIALGYVPGKTIRGAVNADGPMSVPKATRAFADVARGLHAAHAAGYIHRDVKPSNVILSSLGRGTLLDFGFALRRGETPTAADAEVIGGHGYTLGTADYLPPEQATNAAAVGAETDIYSLGCSLYFTLAGRPPFPAASTREKIRLHQTADPLPLVSLNASVPAELSAMVGWLMNKRPEERPQSAEMVADELERWAEPPLLTATRVTYDAAWEATMLERVEAAWSAHRPPAEEVIVLQPDE